MGPSNNNNQFFGVKISQTGTPVDRASDSQLIYKSNFSTNLFNGPGGVWKVMEGVRAPTIGNGLTSPQFGFWVSQDGVDVQQATDAQMVFNSTNTIVVGTYKVTSTDVTNTYAAFSIPHNLGFEPSIQSASFWSSTDSSSRPLPYTLVALTSNYGTDVGAVITVYNVDDTNINIRFGIYNLAGLAFFAANTVLNFKFLCSTLAATGS